jgi:hypothetical protein
MGGGRAASAGEAALGPSWARAAVEQWGSSVGAEPG